MEGDSRIDNIQTLTRTRTRTLTHIRAHIKLRSSRYRPKEISNIINLIMFHVFKCVRRELKATISRYLLP